MSDVDERQGESSSSGFDDLDLVGAAPTKLVRQVVLPALLVTAVGVAAVVAAPLVARSGLSFDRVLLTILGVILTGLGVGGGIVGARAYVSFTEEAIRRKLVLQTAGAWAFSACLLVAGIVGGVWVFTYMGYGAAYGLWFAIDGSRVPVGGIRARLGERLRPALVAECVFVIVAAPVAALISLHATLPTGIASRYIADAVVMPVAALLVLLVLWRRRRLSKRAIASPRDQDERPESNGQTRI